MAGLYYGSMVNETWTGSGTGDVSPLGGAPNGRFTFASQLPDGAKIPYFLGERGGVNFEIGLGTYNAGANSLTRNTVIRSSNSDALVNFPAGGITKDVSLDLAGE